MEDELTQKLNVDYVTAVAVDAAMRLCPADAVYIALPAHGNFHVIRAVGSHHAQLNGRTLPGDRGSPSG